MGMENALVDTWPQEGKGRGRDGNAQRFPAWPQGSSGTTISCDPALFLLPGPIGIHPVT